jgi:hypothetical protein
MNRYTNGITSTLINVLKNPFSAERWANADAEELQALNACAEEMKGHSLLRIWRFATAEAVTRDGGRILAFLRQRDNSPAQCRSISLPHQENKGWQRATGL